MKTLLTALCVAFPSAALCAPCLPLGELIERDRQYEEALRVGDTAFLATSLADDYVWVHSLGSQIETRANLLARLAQPGVVPKSRTTSEVRGHISGDTVVLRGLSSVEQFNADGKTWRTNRYQFMRTWVNLGGACKLLANQTMKVWSSQ
ncbi:nuclear transport factor 2 family protein [Massilia niabensis]|uniref:Nuclear transport factor 2 family protein n=1 Tax=Massilia niabensis TaxID=544910 RepID=A0ABW0L073_9BURK